MHSLTPDVNRVCLPDLIVCCIVSGEFLQNLK